MKAPGGTYECYRKCLWSTIITTTTQYRYNLAKNIATTEIEDAKPKHAGVIVKEKWNLIQMTMSRGKQSHCDIRKDLCKHSNSVISVLSLRLESIYKKCYFFRTGSSGLKRLHISETSKGQGRRKVKINMQISLRFGRAYYRRVELQRHF